MGQSLEVCLGGRMTARTVDSRRQRFKLGCWQDLRAKGGRHFEADGGATVHRPEKGPRAHGEGFAEWAEHLLTIEEPYLQVGKDAQSTGSCAQLPPRVASPVPAPAPVPVQVPDSVARRILQIEEAVCDEGLSVRHMHMHMNSYLHAAPQVGSCGPAGERDRAARAFGSHGRRLLPHREVEDVAAELKVAKAAQIRTEVHEVAE